MKILQILLLVTGLCSINATQGLSAPVDVTTAASPHLNDQDKGLFRENLFRLVLEDLEPGSGFSLLDGGSGSLVSRMTIPELPLDSVTGRTRKLRRELAAIVQWLDREDTSALAGSGALNLPGIAEKISRTPPAILLVAGSPVYQSVELPDQSWKQRSQWLFPSDGTLFGRRGISPWVVSPGRNRLAGKTVHWLLMGESAGPAGLYSERTRRFLSLFIRHEGGALVTYLDDPQRVFSDLERSDLAPLEYELNDSVGNVEMLSANPAVLRRRAEDIDPSEVLNSEALLREAGSSATLTPGDRNLLDQFEKAAKEHGAPVSFAIIWDQPCDLDLYLWEGGDLQPLFFDNSSNRHGTYLRDHGDSTDGDLEQIVMKHAITPHFEAWVNVYEVRGTLEGPITGKLIVRNNGKTRITSFTLQTREGNKGADRIGRGQSPYWQQVLYYSPNGGKHVEE